MTLSLALLEDKKSRYYPAGSTFTIGAHNTELDPALVTASQLSSSLLASFTATCTHVSGSNPFRAVFRAKVGGSTEISGVKTLSIRNSTLGLYLHVYRLNDLLTLRPNINLELAVEVLQ